MRAFLRTFVAFVALLVFFTVPVSSATEETPELAVREIIDDVIGLLKAHPSRSKAERKKVADLVERRVAHRFDFTRLTQLSLGKHWRTASDEERAELTREFRELLVHTYANVLWNYRDQSFTVLARPARPGESDVSVRVEVRRTGAPPVVIDISMANHNGTWQIYDISVESMSLVLVYRDTFNNEITRGGIQGLLAALRKKNRDLRSRGE